MSEKIIRTNTNAKNINANKISRSYTYANASLASLENYFSPILGVGFTYVSELKFEKFHVLAPSHQKNQKCLKMIIFDLMGNHGVKMWRFTNFNSETLLDP